MNGFVVIDVPAVEELGAGEPHGSTRYSQADAEVPLGFTGCVQFKLTVKYDTEVALNKIGFWHGGAGAQVTFATHPAACVFALEVNTKVRLPLGDEEVIENGTVGVPE